MFNIVLTTKANFREFCVFILDVKCTYCSITKKSFISQFFKQIKLCLSFQKNKTKQKQKEKNKIHLKECLCHVYVYAIALTWKYI